MAAHLEDVVQLVRPDLFEYDFLDWNDLCNSSSARSNSKAVFITVDPSCVACSVSRSSILFIDQLRFHK